MSKQPEYPKEVHVRLNAGFGMILLSCSCGWEQEFSTDPWFWELQEAILDHKHR